MSMLNQLFNRGLLGAKCKTCLTLAISRIKLLQNKREAQLKAMRKEIAQFLVAGQEPIARIRVEHIIREQNTWESYEIIELFCEFVLARVPILESQRECPIELREAVATIIFAAPKCSDLPDLLHVRNLFAAKYGKEFIAAATELRPDTSVNRTIIEKLTVSAPLPQVKLRVLKEIALEHNVDWNSTKTEAEFNKKPEDLLNGPKQISVPFPKPQIQESSSSTKHSVNYLDGKNGYLQSPVSSHNSTPTASIFESSSYQSLEPSPQSSDVLQLACVAIAAAERASASARAAAELVNAKFTSLNLVERKS
ncbi:hypothetical protein F511_33540 [Dorcoceras hygrometricum]|uniref:IST1-like protein n=1 Tax=Dorcoceras hygrometricum TaxID=472368 RepID=A0A2Z7D260_9LAMI|nr:hypothetical protein F511_33540 [Dorcoceras hygrometricum]